MPLAQLFSMASRWHRLFLSIPLEELEQSLDETIIDHILPEYGIALKLERHHYNLDLRPLLLRVNAAQWRERMVIFKDLPQSQEVLAQLCRTLIEFGFEIFQIHDSNLEGEGWSSRQCALAEVFSELRTFYRRPFHIQVAGDSDKDAWDKGAPRFFSTPNSAILDLARFKSKDSCLEQLRKLSPFTGHLTVLVANSDKESQWILSVLERAIAMGLQVELVGLDLTHLNKADVQKLMHISHPRKIKHVISTPTYLDWENSKDYKQLALRLRWAKGRRFFLGTRLSLWLRKWKKRLVGVADLNTWGVEFVLEIPVTSHNSFPLNRAIELSILLNVGSVQFQTTSGANQNALIAWLKPALKAADELGVSVVNRRQIESLLWLMPSNLNPSPMESFA